MARVTSATDRPSRSIADHDGVTGTGIVEHGRQTGASCLGRPGQLVGEDPLRIDAAGGPERGELGVEVLAGGADPCVAKYCRHTHTVSPLAEIEDSRHV